MARKLTAVERCQTVFPIEGIAEKAKRPPRKKDSSLPPEGNGRRDAAEKERGERFVTARAVFAASESLSPKQWKAMDSAARAVVAEFGWDQIGKMGGEELALTFLSYGNVRTRADHCKTILEAIRDTTH